MASMDLLARPRVGVNLTSIGVSSAWWLDAASRLEEAGFDDIWCWDHFISRGLETDPVLECFTTLTAAAARTSRIRVGSFVANVMNRHPSLLACMVATLQEQSAGRVVLGIGIGGHPREHLALGLPFPPARERVARLREAVEVLRLLWTGGPVSFDGRHYGLRDAVAHPVPLPPPPIVVGGETPAGARLAGWIGDGWTAFDTTFSRDLPACLEALARSGRERGDLEIQVAVRLTRDGAPQTQPALADLAAEVDRWREAGADGLIVADVRPHQLPALLAAAERAGLAARNGRETLDPLLDRALSGDR